MLKILTGEELEIFFDPVSAGVAIGRIPKGILPVYLDSLYHEADVVGLTVLVKICRVIGILIVSQSKLCGLCAIARVRTPLIIPSPLGTSGAEICARTSKIIEIFSEYLSHRTAWMFYLFYIFLVHYSLHGDESTTGLQPEKNNESLRSSIPQSDFLVLH